TDEQQPGKQMDREVYRPIGPWGQAAPRVIQREGEADQRPASDRALRRPQEHVTQRPEMADMAVFDNRTLIIEHERRGETVRVDRQPAGEEQDRPQPRWTPGSMFTFLGRAPRGKCVRSRPVRPAFRT